MRPLPGPALARLAACERELAAGASEATSASGATSANGATRATSASGATSANGATRTTSASEATSASGDPRASDGDHADGDAGWVRRSLAPGRELARSLTAVCGAAALPGDDDAVLLALADGVAGLCVAMRDSFPGNLCCDLDLVVAQALRRARARVDPAATVREQFTQMSRLQRLYGEDTAIRFRYVHDFVYGFDWAKWVARDPDLRMHVGPFDPIFLDHLERRAGELGQLIADDDAVYGQIDPEHSRNPFPFSREPADELRLHRELAARGLVPVAAWDPDAQPSWRRPYAALRIELAAALGLSRGG